MQSESPQPLVVFLYAPSWNEVTRLSKHHLALNFSEQSKVLYIEAPIHPLAFLTRPRAAMRHLFQMLTGPREIHPNLWVHTFIYPLLFHGVTALTSSLVINKINQYFIRPFLRADMKSFGDQKPIFIVGHAHAEPIIESLNPSVCIYHCSDEFSSVTGFPATYAALEKRLMNVCDAIITTSEALAKNKRKFHDRVVTISNGADFKHFSAVALGRTNIPDDLKRIHNPIIGYIGSIFKWLDYELIEWIARERPQWSFVFIGPQVVAVETELVNLPNVYFLGGRPYAEVPAYLQGFDVAWIPFAIHDVTTKASPIKFYEYLAAGRPVVATRLPELVDFENVAELASTPDEFLAAIESALSDDLPERKKARMEVARQHSWESRFDSVKELIRELGSQEILV